MPTFPATLPEPQLNGYSIQSRDITIRSAMDGGIPRVRRRFTGGLPPHQISVKWRVSQIDFALLDGWLDSYGHDWFNIVIANHLGRSTWQARLTGAWSAVPLGTTDWWEVSASLEVK